MGALASRSSAGVEEVNIPSNNAYRYPPKSGNYFGSHFIMGGERFDTIQPECYLFGENQDLNFLGSRPVPFPYPAPQSNEPTKTLKSLVNIRKDSLRFVKVQEESTKPDEESSIKYCIEFTFDTDVRCAITVYYFAIEDMVDGKVIYHPRDATMNSETFHYKRGSNQTFSQPSHVVDPKIFHDEEWQYHPEKGIIPIVIQCVVEDEAYPGHAHMTFAVIDKNSESGYIIKPLKQKQLVDGLCYLLQEIYGIENKTSERSKSAPEDEFEDNGSECVICMSESRDTLILPCRHLCLCNCCANNLRYQANNCPICRAPFRALLQIRAMRKKMLNIQTTCQDTSDEYCVSQEGVPVGFEAVPLIEALNGQSHCNPLLMESIVPTTRSTPQSGSPRESPNLDKRKGMPRRQPSGGSTSLRDTVVPEEIEDTVIHADTPSDVIDGEQGRGTPEVVMSAQAPDPSKSPGNTPKKMLLPKVRYPKQTATVALETEDPGKTENTSLEIVNELEIQRVGDKCQLTEETDISESDFDSVEGAIAPRASTPDANLRNPDADSSSDEVDFHSPHKVEKANSLPIVAFRPAAHTQVLYAREDDCIEDPMMNSLGLHDTLSLPGTPTTTSDSSTGSGSSSYSSTSSGRHLLLRQEDEPKMQVYKVDELDTPDDD